MLKEEGRKNREGEKMSMNRMRRGLNFPWQIGSFRSCNKVSKQQIPTPTPCLSLCPALYNIPLLTLPSRLDYWLVLAKALVMCTNHRRGHRAQNRATVSRILGDYLFRFLNNLLIKGISPAEMAWFLSSGHAHTHTWQTHTGCIASSQPFPSQFHQDTTRVQDGNSFRGERR